MKRFRVLSVAILAASVLMAGCGGQAAPPTKVRIATDATFPPFETVDNDNRALAGFDIELMKAIAVKANLEVEFANVGFKALLAGVANCQYDGAISALPITPENQRQIAFSEPYFAVGQVLVVKKGNITITGADTLSGMTVGVQRGTPGAAKVAAIAGVQAKTYVAFDMAFEDLINGLIDAVMADQPLALSYATTPSNNLKIVGDLVPAESYGIAVCAKNPDLLKKVNDGLAAVKADGTLAKLTKRWISGGR